MNATSTATIAADRTVFNDRPIDASNVEVTESGDYVVYLAQRVGHPSDEIHVFSAPSRDPGDQRVFEVMQSLTDDSKTRVSEVQFQRGTDDRLIFTIKRDANPCPDDISRGREAMQYLIDHA